MQTLVQFWKGFKLLPSAWLLLVQLNMLILYLVTSSSRSDQILTWALGVLALLMIAKVIRQTPVYSAI